MGINNAPHKRNPDTIVVTMTQLQKKLECPEGIEQSCNNYCFDVLSLEFRY